MKTILVLGLIALGGGLASFTLTAVFVGASAVPASAGSVAAHAEPTAAAAPAPPVPQPTAAPGRAFRLPAGAEVWRPEIEGQPRPFAPGDVPAYLERTAILQLGIQEGLLDRRMTILFAPDSATLIGEFRLRPDPRQREFAQVLAHSLVSSVQALDLPIRVVQLSVTDHTGLTGLSAQVGLGAARSRPPASWEPSAAGVRAFLAWAAGAPSGSTADDRVILSGAWAR